MMCKIKRSAVLVVALVMSAAVPALAQNAKKEPAAATAPAKVKQYDFSADTIDGDLVKPDGTLINASKFGDFGSLIRVRKDFIGEILKSAENL